MQLWDQIDPAQLTGYAREALADREQNAFTLSRWLPSRQVDDLLYRFTRGGTGLVEAARGSLGHWLSIRRGRIERYQIIAPTTWNFSPRDSNAVAAKYAQSTHTRMVMPSSPCLSRSRARIRS